MNDHRAAVESVFRLEAGRILAALIRVSGSFDLAEEALQEALAAEVAGKRKAFRGIRQRGSPPRLSGR